MMLNASHSYLQLLQYIRSSIRYANAFTPHWMVDRMELFDLQGQVLYKQLSRVDCHSCCEGNLATQSLLCIVFSLTLTISSLDIAITA